jgi:hypothetical protein
MQPVADTRTIAANNAIILFMGDLLPESHGKNAAIATIYTRHR